MTYSAMIVADSLAPNGRRLTTFEVTIPRVILAEINTHRDFSRNSASSRAIPVEKMLKAVCENPYIPDFTANQKGMMGKVVAEKAWQLQQADVWLSARTAAVAAAQTLMRNGVHKGEANRLLEPFMWHTVIVSATRYSNFFAQRLERDADGNPLAHPAIFKIASMMQTLLDENEPREVETGGEHLPYTLDIDRADFSTKERALISAGRCAGVSYLRHGQHKTPQEAMGLALNLTKNGHFSPLEHQARAMNVSNGDTQSGNFTGWYQFRKEFQDECR